MRLGCCPRSGHGGFRKLEAEPKRGAGRRGIECQFAAQATRPSLDAAQTHAAFGACGRIHATTAVFHFQNDSTFPLFKQDPHAAGMGMLEDIGQGLLHHPQHIETVRGTLRCAAGCG